MPLGDYTDIAELKTYIDQLAGTVAYDGILGTLITRVSRQIDAYCGRRFYVPASDETYLLDGSGTRRLFFELAAAPTTVRVRNSMQDPWRVVPVADVLLQPADRRAGWPSEWIEITETPSGAEARFPRGLRTVEIVGRRGFTVTPDEVKQAAVEMTVRAWRARDQGFSDAIGVDELGTVQVARVMPALTRQMLDHYRRVTVFA